MFYQLNYIPMDGRHCPVCQRYDLFDVVHQPIVLGAGQLTILVGGIDALLEILWGHAGFAIENLIERTT